MSMPNRQAAPSPGFRIRVWCRDCYGSDPYGCFEGEAQLQDEVYATYEEAEAAGWDFVDTAPYGFEVTDEEGIVIDR